MESLNNIQYYQKCSLYCFSSLIAPLNRLKATFLIACNEIEKDIEDFGADLPNKPPKFVGNQTLIENSFESDSKEFKSDKSIIESLNKIFKKSQLVSNKK